MTPGGIVGLVLALLNAASEAGRHTDTPGAGRPHSRSRGPAAGTSSAVPPGWSSTGSYLGARLVEAAAARPESSTADLAAAFGCSASYASAARAVCQHQPALVAEVIARRVPLSMAHRAAVAARRGNGDAARAEVLAMAAQMREWAGEASRGHPASRASIGEAA